MEVTDLYIQIIIIFVLLGISMALHAVTISMLLKIRREGTGSMQYRKETRSVSNRGKAQKTPYPNNQDVRIVFCKNCSAPFSSKYGVCPKCGTPR